MIYYCNKDDLGISNEELLRLCDDNNIGEWDENSTKKLNDHIKAATDEINSYAIKKYKVPFSPVPGSIKDIAVILTLYKLYSKRNSASKQLRQDYEDKISFLEKLSQNKVGILEIDTLDENKEKVIKPKARIFSNRKRTDRKFYDGLPGY